MAVGDRARALVLAEQAKKRSPTPCDHHRQVVGVRIFRVVECVRNVHAMRHAGA